MLRFAEKEDMKDLEMQWFSYISQDSLRLVPIFELMRSYAWTMPITGSMKGMRPMYAVGPRGLLSSNTLYFVCINRVVKLPGNIGLLIVTTRAALIFLSLDLHPLSDLHLGQRAGR